MAFNYYIIISCPIATGATITADFGAFSVVVNEVRYLTFSGNPSLNGCYYIDDTSDGFDETVSSVSIDYIDCPRCEEVNPPTPTPTPTPTITPTFAELQLTHL